MVNWPALHQLLCLSCVSLLSTFTLTDTILSCWLLPPRIRRSDQRGLFPGCSVTGSGHWGPGWLRAGFQAVVRMMKGRQEPELTHAGAFALGQPRDLCSPLQHTNSKHTVQQQRGTGGRPQRCSASARTQTQTTRYKNHSHLHPWSCLSF